EQVPGVLAEDRAVLRVLDLADLLPGLALVGRGDQAAVHQPVEGAGAPLRESLGTVPPDGAVRAARLEGFAAVGGAQQARPGPLLAFGRGDDGGPGVEAPAGAVALADLDERLPAVGGSQQQAARLVLQSQDELQARVGPAHGTPVDVGRLLIQVLPG